MSKDLYPKKGLSYSMQNTDQWKVIKIPAMKLFMSYILIGLLFLSCNVPKDLNNTIYSYKSKKRTLRLLFTNDSLCRMENIFYCNDIDAEIKELSTTCIYKRVGNIIVLRNINCHKDSIGNMYIDIPAQNSEKCSFLNADKRKHRPIGPSYKNQYEKYGIVPSIDIDTLYIDRNKLMLVKPGPTMYVGFIFKRSFIFPAITTIIP